MATNFRIKWELQTNLARQVSIHGAITVATGGAITKVRPSAAVNNQTVAGAGFFFNVTPVAGSGQATYNVALVEQYLKPVGAVAEFQPVFAVGAAQTVADVLCQCSTFDSATNSFNVTLTNHAGAALAFSAVPAGLVSFEARFINSVSPSTL
jgi:hypothetical protein